MQEVELRMLDGIRKDLRVGFRMLAKDPGFTSVTVLSLALGIGANTAIFTLIDAVMLRMLPVNHPEQLVSLRLTDPRDRSFSRSVDGNSETAFPYPVYAEMRQRSSVLSSLFAFKSVGRLNVQINGEAEFARGQMVSQNYFGALGVPLALGRDFVDEDERIGAAPVAIISDGYWKRRFAGEPSALGKSMVINGVPFTIVGVTPREFFGLQTGGAVDLIMTLAMQPRISPVISEGRGSPFTDYANFWLELMGRIKPGTGEAQVRANLDTIFRESLLESLPPAKDGKPLVLPRLVIAPGAQGLAGLRNQFSKPLFILMVVVGAVLLIACANVANLLLARAAARRKEIAIRLSIGATRSRLIRQLLMESFLLSALGGVAGLLVAYSGSSLLLSMLQRGLDRIVLDLHPDLKVLGFNAGLCLLTALLFGLAPAFRATRVDLTPSLKQGAASLGVGREAMRLTKTLMVSQVAVSLVLLFGAGLFVRTLINLVSQDVGFQRDNLLLFGVAPVEAGYQGQRFATLCQEIQSGVARLPGVRGATASMHLLLSGSARGETIRVPGYTQGQGENMSVRVLPVGTDFLTTMRIPLLIGRDLTAHDDEKSPKVGLINETMAHRFWPNQNPIGRHFTMAKSDFEVVGVVRDTKYDSLRSDISSTVYHPFVQTLDTMRHMHFEVRTSGDAKALIPEVRKVVASIDRRLPLFDVLTQEQQIDVLLSQERFFAKLTAAFGVLALMLVCVGLYGIMSYALARRTSEIGIRIALGAQRGDILRMALREVFALTGIGVMLGVAASYITARLAASAVSGLLFGVRITDGSVVAVAGLLMVAVATLAGLGPARRASLIDAIVALRQD